MPRRVTQPLISKPQTTEVVARPVDIYAKPDINFQGSSSSYKARNAKLLGDLVGNVVKIAKYERDENAKEDLIAGKQDALARKPMDTTGHEGILHDEEAYKKGYRGIEDEAMGIAFSTDYTQVLKDNNYFLDDPDPKARQDDLYKELYAKHFTPEYLSSNGRDGYLTENGLMAIKRALVEGEAGFRDAYIQDRKLKITQSASQVLSNNINNLLNKGVLNADSFNATVEDIVANMRESEGYSLSVNEESSFVIESIGSEALKALKEGKFKRADKLIDILREGKDAEGIKWYDKITASDPSTGKHTYAYKDSIDKIEAEAYRQKEIYTEALKKQGEKAQKENLKAFGVAIANLMVDDNMGDRATNAINLQQKLTSAIRSGAIDPDGGIKLLKTLQEYKGGTRFLDITNQEELLKIRNDISIGKIKTPLELLDRATDHLSREDYDLTLNELEQNNKVKQDHHFNGLNNILQSEKQGLLGELGVQDFEGKLISNIDGNYEGMRLAREVMKEFSYLYYELRQEPTKFDLNVIKTKIEGIRNKILAQKEGGNNGGVYKAGTRPADKARTREDVTSFFTNTTATGAKSTTTDTTSTD